MSVNIYSVYKTSRSCDVVCLNRLHNIWNQILNNKKKNKKNKQTKKKNADFRVSNIPRGTMVNGL